MGPHRDVVGEIADAVRARGMRFGVYHSLFEWFNPLFLQDQANNFTTQTYVAEIVLPMLHDLVMRYNPSVIWSDGDWVATPEYWQSQQFLQWLYNDSPVSSSVVTNDRWGQGTNCVDGGFWTCQDRYNPGKLVNHAWENAFTIQQSTWGFAQNAPISQYLSISEILLQMVSTVAFGGNVLINVGPTAQGIIDPTFQARLLEMGAFLKINGPAIYATVPWFQAQNQSENIYYTATKNQPVAINAILLNPDLFNHPVIGLEAPISTANTTIVMLHQDKPIVLTWKPFIAVNLPGIFIQLPFMQLDPLGITFVMNGLANAIEK